jgi:ABC-type dipeptide/oligopeptide/nickel transport system permease component
MRLLVFTLRRVAWFAPTVLGVVALTFTISHIIPADPAALLAGEAATPEQIARVRAEHGLDQPAPVQFARYLGRVLRGDLGRSLYTTRDISDDLARRLPATLELTLVAMLVTVGLGIPIGVLSALRRNSLLDHLVRATTIAGLAIAAFWMGIMLQLLFSMFLGWTPLGGRITGYPPRAVTSLYVVDALLTADWPALRSALAHLALPAATLGLPAMATVVRFTRAGVLDVIGSSHVLYQRAMGLPGSVVVWKYVLRAAAISTITQLGLIFGVLLAGSVVVETVFDWPGLGLWAVNSIVMSDYNAIMAFTLWVAVVYIAVNFLVDVVHLLVDPREAAA